MAEDFTQRQAEIDEMYEEKGFLRRMLEMISGLGRPRNTREYKAAVQELQRLKAPIIAILIPVVGVITLIVITAVQAQKADIIQVDIASADSPVEELSEEEPEPEQEIDMTVDTDVSVEVSADIPTPQVAAPAPPSPSPGGEPDKVSAAPSPVTMAAVSGTVKMRGLGDGDGGGFGTMIGGKGGGQNIEGCLIGIIADLKRDSNGKDNGYTKNGAWERLKTLNAQKFSKSAMSKYFVAPKQVALNKVYIPAIQAKEGPKAFGLNDCGETGWVAFYTGDLKVAEKMKFRFVGYFDEFMLIRINGKVVFEAEWINGTPQIGGGTKPGAISGWVPSDTSALGKWSSWQASAWMVTGDWIDAEPGKPLKMELALGETAGGLCGGLLCIEVQGKQYAKDGARPVLPVFSSRKLSMAERKKISESKYKFDPNSPSFNARGKKAMEKAKKNDVSVEVDI